jgi:hypothetical protein
MMYVVLLLLALVLGATVLTNAGTAIVSNRLLGAGTEPKQIGWGTGAQTTALVTDTGLGPTTVEKDVDLATNTGTRTTGTSSQQTTTVTNDTYQVTGTRTATGAGTVTVAGLFDNVTIASGSLFVKGDFAGMALAVGDSIAFTFKLKFVAG